MRNPIPVIAICLLLAFQGVAQQGNGFEIFLKSGTYTPERNITASNIEQFNRSATRRVGKSFAIIQFDKLLTPIERQQLAAMGIELLEYIPNFAYTATIGAELDAAGLLQSGARSVIELTPLQKMQPELARGDFPSWSVTTPGTVDVWISIPASFDVKTVIEELNREHFELVSEEHHKYHILALRVPVSRLGELAALPYIEFVQPLPPPLTGLNSSGMFLSKANVMKAPLIAGGRALTGQGVVVGFGDDGDVQTHLDFNGRLINRTGAQPRAHASHVAGTIGGGGLIMELYEGYAPRSTLIGQLFSGILSNADLYVQDHRMVITNNSYGVVVNDCAFNGLYDLTARMLDQLAIELPDLTHVFAAGNNGTLNCPPYTTGFHTVLGGFQSSKNILTVGSTDFTGNLSGFSSRGPVKDGRLKPEIMSQGGFLPSTWTGNLYSYNSGTSMAAPGVSGGLALLTELYRNENGGADPKAGLMKAVISNGGSDRGNSGPDFKYGFGTLNLVRSARMIDDGRYAVNTVAQGATNSILIPVTNGTAILKVLLYWMDPPAAILSSKTLVNDLDLEIVTPSSATVYPYKLDTTAVNLDLAASTGPDHVNNIEQIVIANPAAGNYEIRVRGNAITQNPLQEYFLVFDTIQSGLVLTNPVGGEHFVPTTSTLDSVFVQWDTYGLNESGYTLEFFNGTSWSTVSNSINATRKGYNWAVPNNLTTDAARIRIRGNTSATEHSSRTFVITAMPVDSLTPTQCDGYIQLGWRPIAGVTDYEVMMLQGSEMVSVATTTQLNYTFSGLSRDSVYWVTVRPRINGNPGRRAQAISRQPNNGTCAGSISDLDLRLESIINPSNSGRQFTLSAFGNNETITIRIRNLDDNVSSGDIAVSYSINGGTPVSEIITSPASAIPAGGFLDHSFSVPVNLSAAGTYNIQVSANKASDPVTSNNSLVKVFKQLSNLPILNTDLPWLDNLESMPGQEVRVDQRGLAGRDRYDFVNSTPLGRLRTFMHSRNAYSGNRTITLDMAMFSTAGNVDSLTGTFNLNSFTIADDIRFDFRYKNHGQVTNPANRVWIRGSETDNWVQVFDLFANQGRNDGSYKISASIQISDTLAAYGQNFSTSFQVRIGQWGRYMAADDETGAGYSFDDFRIYKAIDDIQMIKIDTPVLVACGLNATVPVKVIVRNTANSAVTNVPVAFRLDGSAIVNETIPSIPANDTVHYTFNTRANLSVQGQHLLEAWVHYATDNVPENDTLRVNPKNIRQVSGFPYLENFESGDGTWYTIPGTGGSWSYGTPSSAKINRAASGTGAWKTNIYGYYDDNEISYLYSPCFDISGMTNPTFSFSAAIDIEDCGASLCDAAWVEYSIDGGSTWNRLGALNQGTNWYNRSYSGLPVWSQLNYTRWHVATTTLPIASNLRLRFVFRSDVGLTKDGIAIDDIHIYDNVYGIYTTSGESPVVQQTLSGTNWINFIQGGKLIASVNPSAQSPGSTSVQSFIHTGTVRNNDGHYYHNRNITIKPSSTSLSDSVGIRFYFLDTESEDLVNATGCSGCEKPSTAYDLRVTKYSDPDKLNENGTITDNSNGSYQYIDRVSIVPFDKGYYAEFKVKDFSEFWLGLPVSLLSFTATKNGPDVALQWTTIAEMNILRFEVELAKGLAAFQAGAFVKIGELNSQGYSLSIRNYNFNDIEPRKFGYRYYRLRIVYADGSFKYSAVRSVIYDEELPLLVYPNPSSGLFILDYVLQPGENIFMNLFNSDGQLIRQFKLSGNGYAERFNIDLTGHYPAGVYMLETLFSGRKQVFRLVKL